MSPSKYHYNLSKGRYGLVLAAVGLYGPRSALNLRIASLRIAKLKWEWAGTLHVERMAVGAERFSSGEPPSFHKVD
jgi:hypothetical protein